jgi:hypothetical protein
MNLTSALGACAASKGRGASGKTIVFGIFKRNDCVYTEIVPDWLLGLFAEEFGNESADELV